MTKAARVADLQRVEDPVLRRSTLDMRNQTAIVGKSPPIF
jgi:hypothetical protein